MSQRPCARGPRLEVGAGPVTVPAVARMRGQSIDAEQPPLEVLREGQSGVNGDIRLLAQTAPLRFLRHMMTSLVRFQTPSDCSVRLRALPIARSALTNSDG